MQLMSKGGRGHKAPYETKLIRVPVPIAEQVQELGKRYQEFLAQGGEPSSPPQFQEVVINHKPVDNLNKAVDKFIELKRLAWGMSPSQKGEFSMSSRSWDMFRQFQRLLQESPDKLL